MLEAILFLRWGVVLSSVPKVKLVSPPGGRSTLELLLAPGSTPWKVVVVVIFMEDFGVFAVRNSQ